MFLNHHHWSSIQQSQHYCNNILFIKSHMKIITWKFPAFRKLVNLFWWVVLVTACSIFICISSNQVARSSLGGAAMLPLPEVSFRSHTQIAMAPMRLCSPSPSPSPFFVLSFCLLSFLAALAASFLSLLERCLCAEEAKGRGRISTLRGWDIQVCTPIQKPPLVGKSVTM